MQQKNRDFLKSRDMIKKQDMNRKNLEMTLSVDEQKRKAALESRRSEQKLLENLKTNGLDKLRITSGIMEDAKVASEYLKKNGKKYNDTVIKSAVKSINRITYLLLFLFYVLSVFNSGRGDSYTQDISSLIKLKTTYTDLREENTDNTDLPGTLFELISAILTNYNSIKQQVPNWDSIHSKEILKFYISATKLFYAFISYLNDFNTDHLIYGESKEDDFNTELIPELNASKLSKLPNEKQTINSINLQLKKSLSNMKELISENKNIYKNINNDALTIKDKINKLRDRIKALQQNIKTRNEIRRNINRREEERKTINASENSDEFTMDDLVLAATDALEEFYKPDNVEKIREDKKVVEIGDNKEETGWINGDDLVVAATDALEEYFRLLNSQPLENTTRQIVVYNPEKGKCEENYPELWNDNDIITYDAKPDSLKKIADKYKYNRTTQELMTNGKMYKINDILSSCSPSTLSNTSKPDQKYNKIETVLIAMKNLNNEDEPGPSVIILPPTVKPSAVPPPAVPPPAVKPSAITTPAITTPAVTPPAITTPAITPSAGPPPAVTTLGKTSHISSTDEKDDNDKILERCSGTETNKDFFLVGITKIGDEEKCIFFNPKENQISVKTPKSE